jgi:hypothetical protein
MGHRRPFGLALAIAAFSSLPARPALAKCGCTDMKIARAGTTGIVCTDKNLDFKPPECTRWDGHTKGCTTTYAYECALGVNDTHWGDAEPYQRTGFEPRATLAPGSTLAECYIGQVLQETITSEGVVVPNRKINPTSVSGVVSLAGHQVKVDNDSTHPYPQIGAKSSTNPLFGGDNYRDPAAPELLFDVTPTSVSWWDNPDQTKDKQTENATWAFRFVAFVLGTHGEPSCACAFTIGVTWKASTDPATAPYAEDTTLSTNCTW